jgi:hypothetical protein
MTPRKKPYYSVRTGKNPLTAGFDIDAVRDIFKTQFIYLVPRRKLWVVEGMLVGSA